MSQLHSHLPQHGQGCMRNTESTVGLFRPVTADQSEQTGPIRKHFVADTYKYEPEKEQIIGP